MAQVVADAHLAAEAVAPVGQGHLAGVVAKGVDEHRHVEAGETDGVGDGPLVAEIGQGDDDAVDLLAVLLEEVAAEARLGQRLDRAAVSGIGRGDHRGEAGLLEDTQDSLTAADAEMIREKASIRDDHAQS